MKKLCCRSFFVGGLLLWGILAFGYGGALAAPEPTYGTATIDGSYDEWDLSADFFADMYRAGKDDPKHPIESKLYLRYECPQGDCSDGVLHALVLTVSLSPNVFLQPDDAFVKLGNDITLVDGSSGDDGTPPDFQWVEDDPDDSIYALGWEASMLLPPGTYDNLNVHVQVFSDGESQTSAVFERAIDLYLVCNGTPSTPPVPEPATILLFGSGLVCLASVSRKLKK